MLILRNLLDQGKGISLHFNICYQGALLLLSTSESNSHVAQAQWSALLGTSEADIRQRILIVQDCKREGKLTVVNPL